MSWLHIISMFYVHNMMCCNTLSIFHY